MRPVTNARVAVLAGVLAAFLLPASSFADSGFVSPLEEIPLTNPWPAGARCAGMGFVSMAIADDGSSITSNPAALARLNRVELSGGFRRSSVGVDGEMAGSPFQTDLAGTDFTSLRFAYPFPTFRGSLVFGLGIERIYDFGADRLAEYQDEITWEENPGSFESGVWTSREDYLSDGGISSLSAACAMDVSPAISLGLTLSYLYGDYSRAFAWDVYDNVGDYSDRYTDVHLVERSSSDISGFRATFGGLFYVTDQVSVGVAVDSPTKLTFDGTQNNYMEMVATNPESTTVGESSVLFTDEVTLPFSFRGGVAYSPVDYLVLGGDVTYTEWSDLDYAGRITNTESGSDGLTRRTVYDGKLGFGVGAEVTIPGWPLRVRGGYVSRPHAYNGLEVVTDRSYFTFGAGVLIDTVLAVDFAVITGSYERSDSDFAYTETVDESAILVEATYRF